MRPLRPTRRAPISSKRWTPDGDGTLSKTELADGTKKLFEELRTQLASASGGATSTGATQRRQAQSADAAQAHRDAGQRRDQCPAGCAAGRRGTTTTTVVAAACSRRSPQLLDQYRSTATTDPSAATAEAVHALRRSVTSWASMVHTARARPVLAPKRLISRMRSIQMAAP